MAKEEGEELNSLHRETVNWYQKDRSQTHVTIPRQDWKFNGTAYMPALRNEREERTEPMRPDSLSVKHTIK